MPRKSRQITVEESEVGLRIMADPPPVWPVIAATLAILLFVGNLLRMIYPMWHRELHRPDNIGWLYFLIGAVTALLAVLAILILWQRLSRLKAPCGIIIDRGDVVVYAPDDALPEHRFAMVELVKAEMRASAHISHLADLILFRRSGGNITALRWTDPRSLHEAIDRINLLLISDRHYGFEVVVRERKPLGLQPPAPKSGTDAGSSTIMPPPL